MMSDEEIQAGDDELRWQREAEAEADRYRSEKCARDLCEACEDDECECECHDDVQLDYTTAHGRL